MHANLAESHIWGWNSGMISYTVPCLPLYHAESIRYVWNEAFVESYNVVCHNRLWTFSPNSPGCEIKRFHSKFKHLRFWTQQQTGWMCGPFHSSFPTVNCRMSPVPLCSASWHRYHCLWAQSFPLGPWELPLWILQSWCKPSSLQGDNFVIYKNLSILRLKGHFRVALKVLTTWEQMRRLPLK